MQTLNQKQNLEKYPKVLVGCPTSYHKDYCLREYAIGLKKLTYPKKEILIVENSKKDEYFNLIKTYDLSVIKGPWFEGAIQRIITSRNLIRKKVLDEGYDYFLSLEQDVIPPEDIIQKMLRHGKEVVTGVYFANNKMPDGSIKLIPLVYKLIDPELQSMRPLEKEELWDDPGLYPVVSAGLGCVLIHRSVLEQIEFRSENQNFDDRFFFIDCFNKKIEVFADTTIKCKHLISRTIGWNEIKK
jgi:GT2 family glycosyltransferase